MSTARVLVPVAAAAMAFAAPAAADENTFVQTLQTRYVFLSAEQLTAAGAKICNILGSGVPASDAVTVVRDDLGVSVSAAGEIVSLAVVELDC